MSTQLDAEAFKAGLRKLLDPARHFNMCDFDKLIALAGISLSTHERRPFELLHCVDYRDMSATLKEQLLQRIAEILDRGPDTLYRIKQVLAEEAQPPVVTIQYNWFRKLLSK